MLACLRLHIATAARWLSYAYIIYTLLGSVTLFMTVPA